MFVGWYLAARAADGCCSKMKRDLFCTRRLNNGIEELLNLTGS